MLDAEAGIQLIFLYQMNFIHWGGGIVELLRNLFRKFRSPSVTRLHSQTCIRDSTNDFRVNQIISFHVAYIRPKTALPNIQLFVL